MLKRGLLLAVLVLVTSAPSCDDGDGTGADPAQEPAATQTGDEPQESDATQSPDSTQSPEVQKDPRDEQAACLAEKPWHLDVGHFAGQSQAFLKGLGIGAEEVKGEGRQLLRFTKDGLATLDSELQLVVTIVARDTTAVFKTVRTDAAATDWEWLDPGARHLGFKNWEWLAESTSTTGTANGVTVSSEETMYPPYDLSRAGPIRVDCTPGELVLRGSRAPFAARFTTR